MDGKRVPVFCYCVYSRSILPAAVGKKRQDEMCIRDRYIPLSCYLYRDDYIVPHYIVNYYIKIDVYKRQGTCRWLASVF